MDGKCSGDLLNYSAYVSSRSTNNDCKFWGGAESMFNQEDSMVSAWLRRAFSIDGSWKVRHWFLFLSDNVHSLLYSSTIEYRWSGRSRSESIWELQRQVRRALGSKSVSFRGVWLYWFTSGRDVNGLTLQEEYPVLDKSRQQDPTNSASGAVTERNAEVTLKLFVAYVQVQQITDEHGATWTNSTESAAGFDCRPRILKSWWTFSERYQRGLIRLRWS